MILVNYYNEEKVLYPARVKKDNCWSEQSSKKSTVPFFLGHPVYTGCPQKAERSIFVTLKFENIALFD